MKLFVIEGLDGSGKTTQCELLKKRFKVIKFPNGNSELINKYLAGGYGDKVNPYAVSSFFAIDRYLTMSQLEKTNETIICDRYITSNFIYSLDVPIKWQKDYEYNYLGNPKPDGVIFLNMPPRFSRKLIKTRGKKKDIYESNYHYLKEVHKTALMIACSENWKIIDCVEKNKIKSVEEIHKEIMECLDLWIRVTAF